MSPDDERPRSYGEKQLSDVQLAAMGLKLFETEAPIIRFHHGAFADEEVDPLTRVPSSFCQPVSPLKQMETSGVSTRTAGNGQSVMHRADRLDLAPKYLRVPGIFQCTNSIGKSSPDWTTDGTQTRAATPGALRLLLGQR